MKHLQRDLDDLHRQILELSATVEHMIDKAVLALCERRIELVGEVIETDRLVDRQEVQIEEECLKCLALHQPVASDLRRIATVLKINNDLERIGDLAVNIAKRAEALDAYPQFPIPPKLGRMSNLAIQMVRGGLDAFINLDSQAARRVMQLDDEVDELNVQIIERLQQLIQEAPDLVVPALNCFSASRHTERIADHATNIAEDVIYLAEGNIIRHQHTGDSTP